MHRFLRIALFCGVLTSGAALAEAQQSTLATGQKLIEANCIRCHSAAENGESPLTDAPPFEEAAKNYTYDELVDGFLEGLAVRHPLMPDWDMTEDQAEAIATYIMSLKRTAEAKSGDSPAANGYSILLKNCARCHAIDETGDSVLPKAPPFREVVKRYDPAALEESLAEGIVTAHEDMPELSFTPAEVSAIVAYLDTLKAQ